MSQRISRINELLKKEVGNLLIKEIRDSGLFVTITNVKTSADLAQAIIEVTIFPKKETQKALKILDKKAYFIQQELNNKLRMKRAPKIIFRVNVAEEKAQEIEEVLRQLNK